MQTEHIRVQPTASLQATQRKGLTSLPTEYRASLHALISTIHEDGTLEVTDKNTAEVMNATNVKEGKWRIPVIDKKGRNTYRYFDTDAIERYKVRRQTKSIPWEERKKRNNVEASIFQHCFHTRNSKTQYRGLIKHTLQAIARCAWINMCKLFLYNVELALLKA